MTGRIAKAGTIVACVVLLATIVLARYLGDLATTVVSLGSAFVGLAGVAVLAVWLLVRPGPERLRVVLPTLVAVALTAVLVPVAGRLQWSVYLWPRQAALDAFVSDLLAYGRIHEMSDGQRYYKSLNGQTFDGSDARLESPDFPALVPVLAAEQVEPDRYDAFRRRLVSLGFIEVSVTDRYVAFVYDGLLDNLHGVLWIRPGSSPPSDGETIFDADPVSIGGLGHGWYAFGTT